MRIYSKIKRFLIQIIEWLYRKKAQYLSQKSFNYVKKHFEECEQLDLDAVLIDPVISHNEFVQQISYKDETWAYIKNLTEYRHQVQNGIYPEYCDSECHMAPKCNIEIDRISVSTAPLNDNWLCFFLLDKNYDNYLFSFDIEIFTEFTEIQFAFRYQDLCNRYRFMIRDNREAVFECVYKGEFYHNICNIPFTLEKKRKHHVQIYVKDGHYQFLVNHVCLISVKELAPLVSGTDMALILWNVDDTRPIKCNITNISLGKIIDDKN